MPWTRIRHVLSRSLLLGPLALVPGTPSAGDFQLERSVIGAGGAAEGGSYRLHAVIGQPIVGAAEGDGYRATLGFLLQTAPAPDDEVLFADGFEGSGP